jgi:AcrR family transcriptional regulator
MVDLIENGGGMPTPEAVAKQAGVSVASLFRYFPTLDDLREQVSARVHDRYGERFEIPRLGDGPLRLRINRFVRARVALWEAIAPISRLTRARAYDHPAAATLLRKMQRRLADQASVHFAPELAARSPAAAVNLVALITATTSFEAWDMLLSDFDRSPAQTVVVWSSALQALLAPPSGRAT